MTRLDMKSTRSVALQHNWFARSLVKAETAHDVKAVVALLEAAISTSEGLLALFNQPRFEGYAGDLLQDLWNESNGQAELAGEALQRLRPKDDDERCILFRALLHLHAFGGGEPWEVLPALSRLGSAPIGGGPQ